MVITRSTTTTTPSVSVITAETPAASTSSTTDTSSDGTQVTMASSNIKGYGKDTLPLRRDYDRGPKFDGKPENFHIWSVKVTGYLHQIGLLPILRAANPTDKEN